jgi:hypothetical protein
VSLAVIGQIKLQHGQLMTLVIYLMAPRITSRPNFLGFTKDRFGLGIQIIIFTRLAEPMEAHTIIHK